MSTSSSPTFDALRNLHTIIGNALADIQTTYQGVGDFPSLDQPLDRTSPSERLTADPSVVVATKKIIAAAGQLIASVQRPSFGILDAALMFNVPACLGLFEASHMPELLREAGPEGMSSARIAEKTGVESVRVNHVLRLLATHHIVREVRPNAFALNRLSSVIDTGKSFEELKSNPETKYHHTDGIAALVGCFDDEIIKSASYFTEASYLAPDARAHDDDPKMTAFSRAFRCPGNALYSFLGGSLGEGDERYNYMSPSRRLQRFAKGMGGGDVWTGDVVEGFDWASLPAGSTVVDVGGGIGSACMLLAKEFLSVTGQDQSQEAPLRFVVQDLPEVVAAGAHAWKNELPDVYDAGVVSFQAHNFLTPQPVSDAAVFLIRGTLHNWSTESCITVLRQLRNAARPDTKLLLGDIVLTLACNQDQTSNAIPVPGGVDQSMLQVEGLHTYTPPLLPNLGKANSLSYSIDLIMHYMFNAQDRTQQEHIDMCASAGWKVTRVVMSKDSQFSYLTADPIAIAP